MGGSQVVGGSNNISMGFQSGYNITSGQDNILLGNLAGTKYTTGQENIILGKYTGSIAGSTGEVAIWPGDSILAGVVLYSTGSNGKRFTSIGGTIPQATNPQYELDVHGTGSVDVLNINDQIEEGYFSLTGMTYNTTNTVLTVNRNTYSAIICEYTLATTSTYAEMRTQRFVCHFNGSSIQSTNTGPSDIGTFSPTVTNDVLKAVSAGPTNINIQVTTTFTGGALSQIFGKYTLIKKI